MRHFLSFLVSFFYVLNVVAAPAWFPEGIQTKGSSTIGEKSTANSSAVLDVRSTTKGMLPPRMTTAQRTAIASPATGLLVYDTDTLTVWQYNGTGWVEVGSGGAGGAQYNVIENYDFEATTYNDGWTASAGVLAAATGTNILFGDQSATWDASAASQTLSYTSQAIGQGYKNNNCEGAIFVQTPSGTASHTLQVYDGTNVLASVSITSYTTPKEFSTGAFPCPSSGNWQLRIVSNADEPLIAVDNAYLGLARNVGVADLITEWASFTPALSSSGGGSITLNATAKTDPNGKWRRVGDSLEFQVTFRNGSGGAATGSAGQVNVNIGTPGGCTPELNKVATAVGGVRADGFATTGTTTFVNGGVYWISGDAFRVMPNGLSTYLSVSDLVTSYYVTLTARVPCVGWAATQTIMPDTQGWWAAGYISGASVSLGTTAVTTYQEATNSSLTLTPDTGSAPMGITCSSTNAAATPSTGATTCSAGSESLGFAVNVPKSGRYEVCGQFGHNVASSAGDAGINVAFEWVNTATNSQTIVARMGPRTTSGHYNNPASGQSKFGNVTACGQATLSAGLQAFRIFYEQSIPGANGPATNVINIDADPNVGDRAMRVTMRPITTENQTILANSVSTFNQNGSYAFGAGVTAADCTSTPCTLYDGSTPGVTITRSTTGIYSLNYAGLGITKTPTCAISHNRGSGDYKCDGGSATTTSQTIFCYQNTTGSTWVAVDSRPSAVCFVNR